MQYSRPIGRTKPAASWSLSALSDGAKKLGQSFSQPTEWRDEIVRLMVGKGFESYALVKESVDAEKLTAKLKKDIEKDGQFIARTKGKLGNSGFVASAPAEIVAKEREKLEEAERRVAKLTQYVEELS